MNDRTPIVSVIMANYNGSPYLADAIRSVQKQTLHDIEIIVSDDASTDDSVDIVDQLAVQDPRIGLIRSEANAGPGAARNRALIQAKGEWIAIMDADDLMHPARLSTLVAAARADQADIVADGVIEFYADKSRPPRPFLFGCWAERPTWVKISEYIDLNRFYGRGPALGYLKPVIRTSILKEAGVSYDESLSIAEDYDLVLRLLYRRCRMRVYPPSYYYYRRHESSQSHRLSERALRAIRGSDERFLKSLTGADFELSAAVEARMRSVDTALAFEGLLGALRRRDWSATVSMALASPRSVLLLKIPLKDRLSRFRLSKKRSCRDPMAFYEDSNEA
jgi:glycosyltransferase involved in cell wall biosynthesis